MKRLIFLFLLSGACGLGAAPTGSVSAALRAIESQPYSKTSKVVEVRGERGDPQPAEWIVVLQDTSARGGVREVTLVDGKITAERTPLHGPSEVAALAPVDTSKLKFDSDAIFRTAHREAERSQIGFNWIDYALRADPVTKAPVWDVNLYDNMGAPLASLRVSATKGTVVSGLQMGANIRSQTAATEVGKPVGGLVGGVGNAVGEAARKTKNSALHFVGSLQEAFVGERTIGPKEEE